MINNNSVWILLLATVVLASQTTPEHKSVDKRQIYALPLVFPYGATSKLIIGFSTPIQNEEKINLAFSGNIQYQYTQFQNITQLSQYYVYNTVSREIRTLDNWENRKDERITFYKAVEELMNSRGMNGHQCLLRAICEAAQASLEEEGLVGEILHILLTPLYGKPVEASQDQADLDWRDIMVTYISAQEAGSQMYDCLSIYEDCPLGQGIMELISELRG